MTHGAVVHASHGSPAHLAMVHATHGATGHGAARHRAMVHPRHRTVVHATVRHAHVRHAEDRARSLFGDSSLHTLTRRQRRPGIARTINRLGKDRERLVIAWKHDDVVCLADTEAELVDTNRLDILPIGGEHGHGKSRYADVEEAHGRCVDKPEPDTLTGVEQSGPVVFRSTAVDQEGVSGHVREVGRVHPHVAPFHAVLQSGIEPVAVCVPEEVDEGPFPVIVVAGIGLQVGQNAHRVFLGMVREDHNIVAIRANRFAPGGFDDDGAVHALLLLHRGVAVVPIGTGLAQLEPVGVGLAGLDGDIAVEAGCAIHDAFDEESVPVDGRGRIQTIGRIDHDLVTLAPAHRRRRHGTAHQDGVAANAIDGDAISVDVQRVLLRRRGEAAAAGIDSDGAGEACRSGELERVPSRENSDWLVHRLPLPVHFVKLIGPAIPDS